jgi:predicted RNA binding protein YcfA (HicA-like mRNA interferase family)
LSKLPVIKAKELEKVLINLGFEKIRQKGSHVFYRHLDGRYTTIPHHPSRDLAPSLLNKILKEINLNKEEFKKLL